MRHLSVFGLLLLGVVPAVGQEGTAEVVQQQQRCWLGAMSYSPGTTLRAGNEVMICTADFVWTPTEQWAAGCVHGGDFYSVGAVQNASSQQQVLSQCLPDGSWGRLAL